MNCEVKFDIEEMDELYDSHVAAEKVRKPWSAKGTKQPALVDAHDLLAEDFEDKLCNGGKVGGLTVYAWHDVVCNWPKIRKLLENKGEWSDMWEEGSHAISMTGFGDARALVGKIEAKVKEDEFHDECW